MYRDPSSTLSKPPAPYRRVLVGWDASRDSVTALNAAAALAGIAHGEVVAMTVLNEVHGPEQQDEMSSHTRWLHQTFESTRSAIQDALGIEICLHTEDGNHVARSLCGYARDRGFDLLVLGRHGHEGFLHPKLGHVAHAVAKTSEIPVLLVSAPTGFGQH